MTDYDWKGGDDEDDGPFLWLVVRLLALAGLAVWVYLW